jgi:hypothetical protein
VIYALLVCIDENDEGYVMIEWMYAWMYALIVCDNEKKKEYENDIKTMLKERAGISGHAGKTRIIEEMKAFARGQR